MSGGAPITNRIFELLNTRAELKVSLKSAREGKAESQGRAKADY